ncbi:MAG: type II toxin-antitoxin system VapC family toxin [Acidimicrobiia bacterium]
MIVVDASVLANVVGDDAQVGRVARARLAVASEAAIPDLADVETVSVLRKRWIAGAITARRFRTAVGDLQDLPLDRYATGPLLLRAYALRANVTPYDAVYVALAEVLGAVLLTADGRLDRAPGVRCGVEILRV